LLEINNIWSDCCDLYWQLLL